VKRRITLFLWRFLLNPLSRPLAGIAPFWVLLETTGRKTGRTRQTPLARGPVDGSTTWVIAVHGRHASFVRNLESRPDVRLKIGRRWRNGTASIHDMDPDIVNRFNAYARSGPRAVGIDPALVRIDLR
jgi:deazaflavin-dependent oxidoreductase (nitroreductase family)